MRAGWIPAHRKIYDPEHWLAPTKRDPSNRRDAWLDLCQMATHTERETAHSGVLERGEVVVSVRTLARRWQWSKSRVSRFMSDLETRTAIGTVRGTPDGTVYRIVNYDTYAVGGDGLRDTERDDDRDRDGTAAGQEQEGKNGKNDLRRGRSPLPEDWSPTEEHRQQAKASGIDIARESESFRAHAVEKGRRSAQWDAAFTRWLLKAEDFSSKSNGRSEDLDAFYEGVEV